MSVHITLSAFKSLLKDDAFVDYLNKFLALPVFGQRTVYRKKTNKFIFEPQLPVDVAAEVESGGANKDVIEWIWSERLPFFFRSQLYGEYKLARALIEYDLVCDGGVEENVARSLEYLQFHCFSKMSRFSKFCKFLNEHGEGIKLIAFFVAAQRLFVAHREGSDDVAVEMGEIRDNFFDETSYWCLPRKVTKLNHDTQASNMLYFTSVSQRVLSRICLYWLPRYLTHLRVEAYTMEEQSCSEEDLRFRDEILRVSESMAHLKIFATGERDDNNLDSGYRKESFNLADTDIELNSSLDLAEVREEQRDVVSSDLVNLRSSCLASNAFMPGQNIRIERRKSARLSISDAANKMSTRINSLNPKKSSSGLQVGREDQTLKPTISNSRLTRKISATNNKTSVTSLFGRASNVKKAVSAFKLKSQLNLKKQGEEKPKVPEKMKSQLNMRTTRQPLARVTSHTVFKKTDKLKTEIGIKKGQLKADPEISKKNSKIMISATNLLNDDDHENKNTPEAKNDSTEANTVSVTKKEKAKQTSKVTKKEVKKNNQSLVDLRKCDDGSPIPEKPIEKTQECTIPERLSSNSSVGNGLGTIMNLKRMTKSWKSKTNQSVAALPKKVPFRSDDDDHNKKGTKMMFSLTKEPSDPDTPNEENIKIAEPDEEDEEEAFREAYLRKRRNACTKIKPMKTLRKRVHSDIPNSIKAPGLSIKVADPVEASPKTSNENTREKPNTATQNRRNEEGKRKADFVKKALTGSSALQEKISVERKGDNKGDGFMVSVYPMNDDNIYRHEMRHLRAALRSDDFASGPFMNFLVEEESDEQAMYALQYWQEAERFRDSFSGMGQAQLMLSMDSILTKFLLNDRALKMLPGMKDHAMSICELDILDCLAFPWQLRIVQRVAMDHLNAKWKTYIKRDAKKLFDQLNVTADFGFGSYTERTLIECFSSDDAPLLLAGPSGSHTPERTSVGDRFSTNQAIPVAIVLPEGRLSRDSQSSGGRISSRISLMGKRSSMMKQDIISGPESRHRESRKKYSDLTLDKMHSRGRDDNNHLAMIRRTKRAYNLAEQTCRLTLNRPENAVFICDESDDEGFVKPKAEPVYLRTKKLDPKALVEMAAKEYPGDGSAVQPKPFIAGAHTRKSGRIPGYMKGYIRKNGAVIKRPLIRPKHLIDCLRDPVHFEFFRRFAIDFHFERVVKFWKSVEVMKHMEDPQKRQLKVRHIMKQFFAKGFMHGIGIDTVMLREIANLPPNQVTVTLLISAQASVMKELEEMWGERYLSTFPETRKTTVLRSVGFRGDLSINNPLANLPGAPMTNIWRVFYAFIKRSAKFIKCMRNHEMRKEFEAFLGTVGRDPSVYQEEGWLEIPATNVDSEMNSDLVLHQRKHQGRLITAEFLVNDFRFWCDIECFRAIAERVHTNRNDGLYFPIEELNLTNKASLICDQYLNSPILPRLRVNISTETCITISENIKLKMLDMSLFHDCTMSIFPLVLIYWKKFCLRRHKYIPRNQVLAIKRNDVAERRKRLVMMSRQRKLAPKKENKKNVKTVDQWGDSALVDYCSSERFTQSWMDVVKSLDDHATFSFSIERGPRLQLAATSKNYKPGPGGIASSQRVH